MKKRNLTSVSYMISGLNWKVKLKFMFIGFINNWTNLYVRYVGKVSAEIMHWRYKFKKFMKKKKTYVCPTYDEIFSLKCVITSLVVTVHEKAKHFTCSFCNLSFSRRHHLKTHIAKFHEPPRIVNVLWKWIGSVFLFC